LIKKLNVIKNNKRAQLKQKEESEWVSASVIRYSREMPQNKTTRNERKAINKSWRHLLLEFEWCKSSFLPWKKRTLPEFIYEIREHMMTFLWHHYFYYVGRSTLTLLFFSFFLKNNFTSHAFKLINYSPRFQVFVFYFIPSLIQLLLSCFCTRENIFFLKKKTDLKVFTVSHAKLIPSHFLYYYI
jgi:hypothetical protein